MNAQSKALGASASRTGLASLRDGAAARLQQSRSSHCAEVQQMMIENGIERIVLVPASDLIPGSVHAWTFDGYLAEHCGRGDTIEEAIRDAVRRMELVAA